MTNPEKDKFGKWASKKKNRPINPILYQPIENQVDIDALRNTLAMGNYPLGMSDCETVGINGDCGPRCPVYLRGDCPHLPEFKEKYPEEASNE